MLARAYLDLFVLLLLLFLVGLLVCWGVCSFVYFCLVFVLPFFYRVPLGDL